MTAQNLQLEELSPMHIGVVDIGPNTEPCGMLQMSLTVADCLQPRLNYYDPPDRYGLTRRFAGLFIQNEGSSQY